MPYRVLILGASYGALLGTKLAAAGHDVTLVCRAETARLINAEGTEVRIRLRDEAEHRSFFSRDLPGRTDAATPDGAQPAEYDLVCLAMQEPQYSHPDLARLMSRIAASGAPCMSIMNMPPLTYLRRVPALREASLGEAFANPRIWQEFEPRLMTLCSPDPQAFRPPGEPANVLHVGLPTNFKVSRFGDATLDAMLEDLEAGIEAFRVDGKDVPVKLRVFDSLYVPFAKWAMLATGNYRCVTPEGARPIRDAVHSDVELSREIYGFVNQVVTRLGADEADLVPFEKYAEAARNLLKPSSAARAVYAGATQIERVDKLIGLVAASLGMSHPVIEQTIALIDRKLDENRSVELAG
ncbi:ketopantoate reductase family protein [Amaricoccus solimangrovi]|uniref:Ketopantoate reductase N-terminal domain-containing protein n=1 Tax=Amaricoccus solimangrovi TaxID=2589815 RepID=A0A501WT06_9RHOB|nr:2-dehydropantoate 2-reductase N-terminal domain-containing protein [Amaricoccus solimangrovi]TPE48926.1 hypothetical protein FJM51_15980 [Amaricoccus solimangrovi]